MNHHLASARHVPVMRERIVELLAEPLRSVGAVYVDFTLGLGGHAEAILECYPSAHVVGVDRDEQALALARERLAEFGDRVRTVHARYDDLDAVLSAADGRIDAALFDLGVSSMQLDERDRGFAYAFDAPLDMRMDQGQTRDAAQVVAQSSAPELEAIFRHYGEERYARRIAAAIVQQRASHPITTTGQLVELVRSQVPPGPKGGGHPAKRVFQALRIAVNDELAAWEQALPAALNALAVGGRMAVLAYHSLEDRIAKRAFAAGATSASPLGLPVELPQDAPTLAMVTRGAERPSAHEVHLNPRAASARLRVVQKIRHNPVQSAGEESR